MICQNPREYLRDAIRRQEEMIATEEMMGFTPSSFMMEQLRDLQWRLRKAHLVRRYWHKTKQQ